MNSTKDPGLAVEKDHCENKLNLIIKSKPRTNIGHIAKLREDMKTYTEVHKKQLNAKLNAALQIQQQQQKIIEKQREVYYKNFEDNEKRILEKLSNSQALIRKTKTEKLIQQLGNVNKRRREITDLETKGIMKYQQKLAKEDQHYESMKQDEQKHWDTVKKNREQRNYSVQCIRKRLLDKQQGKHMQELGKRLEKIDAQVSNLRKQQYNQYLSKKQELEHREQKTRWRQTRKGETEGLLRSLECRRIQEKLNKAETFSICKENSIKQRVNLSIQSQLSKDRINTAMYQMAVSNHWDPQQIKKHISFTYQLT